ncbi:DUF1552 domain-containing protein [Sandaracinus amylolyticus]|nr:DUF1552 domain-containing protein [Sandaracinus amylolyticus]
MKIDRRKFLAAMGVGGAALTIPGAILGRASKGLAQVSGSGAPKRVLFWITPHGTVWNAWNMNVPGLAPSGTSAAPLSGLAASSWPRIAAPLQPHASKLSFVEGIARTAAIEYERAHDSQGGSFDLNRHHFGEAHLMTCVDPMQRSGTTCIGGGISIDQVIGRATTAAGRWSSRVYGSRHGHPYSFVAAGQESARVEGARQAYDDIVGAYNPPSDGGGDTRADLIARARGSVLDFAAREHTSFASRLPAADRLKLQRHQELIRELEISFADSPEDSPAMCSPTWSDLGHDMDRFARVMALGLSCDLTRVMTYVTPDLAPVEIGLPAATDIHQDYAHTSIQGSSTYRAEGERGMIEYNRFYAQRFAYLLEQLDSIPEAGGTMLDHTAVVWMSELGTGNHDLHDLPIVIAGGAGGSFRMGQYIRLARDTRVGAGWGHFVQVGPAQNRLYVSLMRAMGMENESFGIESSPTASGGTVSLRGVIPEIMNG